KPSHAPQASLEQVRQHLRQRLPEYMLPSLLLVLDSWPVLPNGKLDRQKLSGLANHLPTNPNECVLPRDLLEFQLKTIFETILGIQPVSITDNFFTLGGHSLSALRLVYQLRTQFERELPVSILFQHGTIEALSAILRQQSAGIPSHVVRMNQSSHSGLPFICVHPAGGSILPYIDFARHLEQSRCFYGLQAPGIDGELEPYERVEDLARFYIEKLRDIQQHGPYLLGGWSFGGLVAFEMAQQLTRNGERVVLAMFDTSFPSQKRDKSEDELSLVFRFVKDLAGNYRQKLPFSYQSLQSISSGERWTYVLEALKSVQILPADEHLPQLYHLFTVFKANTWAASHYVPLSYPGELMYFAASRRVMRQTTTPPEILWRNIVKQIHFYKVAGHHYSLIRDPHVRDLAERLEVHLQMNE
ncbi:MAG TPA: alpha/beta fold hydrolase, partial [Ktedonobacteraceae bacterium]|nr:alpha/beta fold hydrolase [Ktedonobacteraceae bacterium]